jgi:glutamate/tyrosine decarboxylase-like PLP-dependent enzyme
MRTSLPEQGLSRQEVLEHLRALKQGDVDWAAGRAPLYVFKADDDVGAVGREAFVEYFNENALGARRAFASIRILEEDIVGAGLSLLNAPAEAAGYFTTGGTESIVCAVKACRSAARARRGADAHGLNIVLPETGHPAFTKAGDLMDIAVRRIPVGADLCADVAAMEASIDANTIMIVGSAPCFPYGVIDPVESLSELAIRRGLWLHVDACVGGYLAPFVAALGVQLPLWDFSVPGVCSISADLHKFGYCPKPSSTVFYRSNELAKHQPFEYDVWPSGLYSTATIVGTRPGGGPAGAWATLNHLGRDGYLRVTRRLLELVARYRAGIEAIPGLQVNGSPHLSILSFTHDRADMHQVGERMRVRGWLPGLVKEPRSMHLMLSLIHEPACDAYLADLRACVDEVRRGTEAATDEVRVTY